MTKRRKHQMKLVSLPAELLEFLKKFAAKEHRSANAQILLILEKWREDQSLTPLEEEK